jgi:hypothetical protein
MATGEMGTLRKRARTEGDSDPTQGIGHAVAACPIWLGIIQRCAGDETVRDIALRLHDYARVNRACYNLCYGFKTKRKDSQKIKIECPTCRKKSGRHRIFGDGGFNCPVCLTVMDFCDGLVFSDCGHMACIRCVDDMLIVKS